MKFCITLELQSDTKKCLGQRFVRRWKTLIELLAIMFEKPCLGRHRFQCYLKIMASKVGITEYQVKGPDKQGVEISNILKYVWK